MPRHSLANLGALVRSKRGANKLRETAAQIGISAPTLMRVEGGRMPDIETFGKICRWLEIDPGTFLGYRETTTARTAAINRPGPTVSAHFKTERTPEPNTISAIARMLLLVAQSQPAAHITDDDA